MHRELKGNEELLNKIDKIGDSLNDIDKIIMILEIWEHEYYFNERPNPELIFDTSLGTESIERHKALKWYWEYHVIVGYIQIVRDYVYKVEKSLKEVLRQD